MSKKEENPFEQMFEQYNNTVPKVEVEEEQPPKVETQEQKEEVPANPEAQQTPTEEPEQPTQETKVEAEETETPPQSEEPTPTPTVEEQPKTELSAEEQQQQYQEQWDKAVSEATAKYAASLAGDHFLDEQQAQIASVLGQAHVGIANEIMQLVMQQAVPLVTQVMQSQAATQDMENQFYGMWPGLKDEKYLPDISNLAQYIAEKYPDSSPEERMKKVGAAVCVAHELDAVEISGKKESKPQVEQQQTVTPPTPLRAHGGANPSQPEVPKGTVEDNSPEMFAEMAANHQR